MRFVFDNALRIFRRAGGEQKLDDRVSVGGVMCRCRFGARGRFEQRTEARGLPPGDAALREDHLHVRSADRRDSARVPRAAGEDKAGRDRLEDMPQLREVIGDQRVSRRDRRVGDSHPHRPERQDQVLDVVFRQDHDRPLGRQPALQQRLADALGSVEHLRVGDAAPFTILAALGNQGTVRRLPSPMREPVGHALRVGLERLGRAQDLAAVRPGLDVDG